MKEHADDVTLHMLPPPFFDRPADVVARELIGVRLVRRLADRTITTELTETEAYLGPHDLACHAAKGRSKRNDALYGPPGTLYVYLCYGIHWMLNFVTGDEGYPAAVLARGSTIASGPGRLTAALAIDRALDGQPMGEQTGLARAARQPRPPAARDRHAADRHRLRRSPLGQTQAAVRGGRPRPTGGSAAQNP